MDWLQVTNLQSVTGLLSCRVLPFVSQIESCFCTNKGCGTSWKCDVQVLHMQTQGDPNPTEGQEPQLGWMALYPESRYLLTPAQSGTTTTCRLCCMHHFECVWSHLV